MFFILAYRQEDIFLPKKACLLMCVWTLYKKGPCRASRAEVRELQCKFLTSEGVLAVLDNITNVFPPKYSSLFESCLEM